MGPRHHKMKLAGSRTLHYKMGVHSAKKQQAGFHFKWNAVGRDPPPPYGLRPIASKQSAGTHLSAMTQNSLHGGTPV